MAASLFIVFFLMLLISVPISVSLIVAAAVSLMIFSHTPMVFVIQKVFNSMDSFALMAIPFFMMAGGLLEKGGVSNRLTNLANSLVGWLPGGLAIVVFVSSAFFGAISGSSAATVAAIGSIMVPAMLAEGYPLKFSLATVASGGYLGIIIPPSIPMVIYSIAAGVNVGDVFMGGFIPGIMLAAGMSVYSFIWGRKHMKVTRTFDIKEVWRTGKEAIWALIMPGIILGGIYGGIFTPTEAAAVSCLYGLLISVFIYKELNLKKIYEIMHGSIISSAMVMFVIAGATVFGMVMTQEMIPAKVAYFVLSISHSTGVFLLLVTILLFIVGTFLDTVPAVMILTPIFVPVLAQYGISPVAFGVIMIINLGIGLVTPPVGMNLYVAAGLRKTTVENVLGKDLVWYIVASTIVLIILMAFPQIIMYLPNLMVK